MQSDVLKTLRAQLAELWRHERCQVCLVYGMCAHRNARRDLVELAALDPVDGWPVTRLLRKRAQRATSAHRAPDRENVA